MLLGMGELPSRNLEIWVVDLEGGTQTLSSVNFPSVVIEGQLVWFEMWVSVHYSSKLYMGGWRSLRKPGSLNEAG